MADLRAIAEAATPGPWHHGPLFWEGWAQDDEYGSRRVFEVPHVYPDGGHQPGVFIDPEIGRTREADAAHIAAWSPDRALAALDVIEALQRSRDRLNEKGTIAADAWVELRAALDRWDALP